MSQTSMEQEIRAVQRADVEGLRHVIDSCGLFPSEYLDGMIADYVENTDTTDIWFTCITDGRPVAIGYCVPEELTEGTYNLLAIGVAADAQRKGVARGMMAYIEQLLRSMDGRLLIVETSSDEAQQPARAFYAQIGYSQEAVIRDFWKDGEDKIVFAKRL